MSGTRMKFLISKFESDATIVIQKGVYCANGGALVVKCEDFWKKKLYANCLLQIFPLEVENTLFASDALM